MFVATNIGGILVGTIVGIGAAYSFGGDFDAGLMIKCFAISTALNLYGSFFWWPDLWQSKS